MNRLPFVVAWNTQEIQPRYVGELEDTALMKVFADRLGDKRGATYMQTRKNALSSTDERSSDLRWCHPLSRFLGGVGFWISHVVIAVAVTAVVLLTWFDVQTDGVWGIVAAPAMVVFGFAMLFAFAGWIARSSR